MRVSIGDTRNKQLIGQRMFYSNKSHVDIQNEGRGVANGGENVHGIDAIRANTR